MSAEAESFQAIHRAFKKLLRLKSVVKINSDYSDVFDVFVSYLDDILVIVSNEYERCVRYDVGSNGKRLRLAAMQIALNHEKTNAFVFVDRNNERPSPQVLGNLKSCLQRFEADQLTNELFFVYFRALNYLSLAQLKRFGNKTIAQHYLMRAEQMYDSLKQCEQPHAFYDFKQLFAKTVGIQPIERGQDKIDSLFMEYLRQSEEIHRSTHDVGNLIKIMQLQLKIRTANSSRFMQMQGIIRLAQLLLSDSKLKSAAYYLIVALKMLGECNGSEQKSDAFVAIRLTMATAWMSYTLAVLAASTDFIQKMISGEQLELLNRYLRPSEPITGSQATVKPACSLTHCDKIGDGNSNDAIDMYHPTIQLSPTEITFCLRSIQHHSHGPQLLDNAIDIIDGFIASTDVAITPMDYLIFHYQLADLLLIRSTFEENFVPKYSFLKLRFERCNEMIQTLNEDCPEIFEVVCASVLDDLSEILLDLYLCNVSRSHMYGQGGYTKSGAEINAAEEVNM